MVEKSKYVLSERIYVEMPEEEKQELIKKITNTLVEAGYEKDNFEFEIKRIIPEIKTHYVSVTINNPYINKYEINALLSSFGTINTYKVEKEKIFLRAHYKRGIFEDVSKEYIEELENIVANNNLQREYIINKDLSIQYRGFRGMSYYLTQKGDDGKKICTVSDEDYRRLAKALFLYNQYGIID